MKNVLSKNNKFLRPGLSVLIFFLLIAAGVSYNYFSSEKHSYFILNKNENRVTFNSSELKELYAGFTSVPYHICSEFSPEKLPGVKRVFLIGEASVSGWPYSSQQSVAGKIAQFLPEYAPALRCEIISLGIAGLNSTITSEILPQVFQYKPDLIIIYSGHNEFYGYNNSASGKNTFTSFQLTNLKKVLMTTGPDKSAGYDNKVDDFELLLPLCSDKMFIYDDTPEFTAAVERFRENLLHIISLCKENKVSLVLTELADNMQLPPVGISGADEQNHLSADLIFNNARMALLRDGNDNAAEKLFNQSKELDAFRLRIPGAILAVQRELARTRGVHLAGVKDEMAFFSQNQIPGTDLFADYIHPNVHGLNIIAAVYSRIILKMLKGGRDTLVIKDMLERQKSLKADSLQIDLLLFRQRMEKAAGYLKASGLSKKYPGDFH